MREACPSPTGGSCCSPPSPCSCPPFARFRWLGSGGPPVAIGGVCLLVITSMAWDRSAHGRIHPALLWGGGLLMLSLPARFAFSQTDAWLAIARWLIR